MKRSLKIAVVSATMLVSLFQATPAHAACGGPFLELPAAVPGVGADRNADGLVCVGATRNGRVLVHDNH